MVEGWAVGTAEDNTYFAGLIDNMLMGLKGIAERGHRVLKYFGWGCGIITVFLLYFLKISDYYQNLKLKQNFKKENFFVKNFWDDFNSIFLNFKRISAIFAF